MKDPYQTDYWNGAGARKRFSHPLDREFLAANVALDRPILDVGCGYGRALVDLESLGYRRLVGVDTSRALIERGQAEAPGLDLRVVDGGRLPFEDGAFDLVLLLAVLTSIPSLDHQAELLDETERILAPGGHVMISDLLIQEDARNQERYQSAGESLGYGAFATGDGGVFRHHDAGWLERLSERWREPVLTRVVIETMNGNPIHAFRLTGRKAQRV